MNIGEFVENYNNHPVLFIGTGLSLRYFRNSYTWDGLLSHICSQLFDNEEEYLNIKSECEVDGRYDYEKIATKLEVKFNKIVANNRHGKFENINDIFFKKMKDGENCSRFKIYITELLKNSEYKEEMQDEIAQLRKVKKNISSIITTNYDTLVEDIFKFNPLVGNNILLSNPYGAIYKIHGCVTEPKNIIITKEDYEKFNAKYELVRAQLLSLFIHNPIIFMGYEINDRNIKDILKTIFTYVTHNSNEADEIRKNFLLVEYEKGSINTEITEHDIEMEGFATIRINKIKTDNFMAIYESLSKLHLPVSAMDIWKVENIVKEIKEGGKIQVQITDDIKSLNNDDKILVIGSKNRITYDFKKVPELMENYFDIIEEENKYILQPLDKFNIQSNQYFPMFGFALINTNISCTEKLKKQQISKLQAELETIREVYQTGMMTINAILSSDEIANSYKNKAIFWSVYKGNIELNEFEEYLKNNPEKYNTDYRKLLCLYDWKKYSDDICLEDFLENHVQDDDIDKIS